MRRIVNRLHSEDSGAMIVIAALSMFAIMALATLAIDGGLSHNERSRAQNGADNAALAGAWAVCEDRDPIAAALSTASANGLGSPSSDATVNVEDLGDGVIRVTIDLDREAEFGRAIGSETIGVSATATATCSARREGVGAIPFGVPPSGFSGGLQAPNPCGLNSGNCGRMYAYRLDGIGDVGDDTRKNIAQGTDRLLMPWKTGDTYVNCSIEITKPECNVLPSNTGVSAGQLGDGFIERLSDTDGAKTFTYKSNSLNGDTLGDVLGFDPPNLEDHGRPLGWLEGIHGEFGDPAIDLTKHYWVNDTIAKCHSPRLASTLIVTSDMTYDPKDYVPGSYDYPDPWPSGSKPMKVLGHYFIYIDDPNEADDFQGSGNLKTASSKVLWLGPNAKCADDTMPGPAATNPVIREVGLTS
ncbi:MAG: pilus assembly protein TadG-related protein [Acidimicrobiia bacterium]